MITAHPAEDYLVTCDAGTTLGNIPDVFVPITMRGAIAVTMAVIRSCRRYAWPCAA